MTIVLKRLADTLTPLALVSVGLQLKFSRVGLKLRHFFLGLTYKLILAPLFIFMLYMLMMHEQGLHGKVSVIQAGMPPMVTAAILSQEYKLNPELSNLMTGFGIPMSFISLGFWWWFLG